MPNLSRCIVVDTDVVKAASGGDATRAAACANVLTSLYRICHHVALTDEILAEWQRHYSRFSSRWLSQMFGKKKVDRLTVQADVALERAVSSLRSGERTVAQKDLHIVGAALHGDGIVLSCDDAARGVFSKLAVSGRYEKLLWGNPEKDPEGVIRWLAEGAPDKPRFRLVPRRATPLRPLGIPPVDSPV